MVIDVLVLVVVVIVDGIVLFGMCRYVMVMMGVLEIYGLFLVLRLLHPYPNLDSLQEEVPGADQEVLERQYCVEEFEEEYGDGCHHHAEDDLVDQSVYGFVLVLPHVAALAH